VGITNRHESAANGGASVRPDTERDEERDPLPMHRTVAQWLSASVAKLLVAEPGEPRSREAPTDKKLSELGVDSLKAIALQYQVQTAFNVMLPLEDLLGRRTIDDLADLVIRDAAFRPDGAAGVPATADEVVL
jgi:acyl carrier protein